MTKVKALDIAPSAIIFFIGKFGHRVRHELDLYKKILGAYVDYIVLDNGAQRDFLDHLPSNLRDHSFCIIASDTNNGDAQLLAGIGDQCKALNIPSFIFLQAESSAASIDQAPVLASCCASGDVVVPITEEYQKQDVASTDWLTPCELVARTINGICSSLSPGLVALDIEELYSFAQGYSPSALSYGIGKGPTRAVQAAQETIRRLHQLAVDLGQVSRILLTLHASYSFKMSEMHAVINIIRDSLPTDLKVFLQISLHEDIEDFTVTAIATDVRFGSMENLHEKL